jgi:hypothetical protein
MKVSIPDDVAETLQTQLKGRRSLEAEVALRLTETLHAPDGRVVLSLHELQEIADRLGTGLPMRNKLDLDRALSATAQIHMGDARLVFTPSQFVLIEERAQKAGETTERFIGMVAAKVIEQIFMIPPGAQGVFYTPGFDPDDSLEDEEPADAAGA